MELVLGTDHGDRHAHTSQRLQDDKLVLTRLDAAHNENAVPIASGSRAEKLIRNPVSY